jgi:hypothetical protein
MQIDQCNPGNPRSAELHARADDGIQHPRRDNDYYSWRCLNVRHATRCTLLSATQLDVTPVQRMPTIVNLDFLPDMGRMTRQSRSVARTGSSPAVKAVVIVRRCSIR